jgi:hypothetical protein
MSNLRDYPPLVVTAADHRFARTLFQFLLSAERHGEAGNANWLVYDLGLTAENRAVLARRFAWAGVRTFGFFDYPPHVAVSAGSYAWKPLIISDVARTHLGQLLWFDSATVLKAPLDRVLAELGRQGFWGLRSQMPLAKKCDPRVMDVLKVPSEVRHFREYAAGAVGFDTRLPLGRDLVTAWGEHALIPDHIVPPGYPPFHKHDQAVLNCLLATAAFEGRFEPASEEIDISSAVPFGGLSTRNFVPGTMPLWADPAVRGYYAGAKAADRVYHRLRILDNTLVDGFRRSRKEHFSIRIMRDGAGATLDLPSPRYGYYADPFIHVRDGQPWVFAEEFSFAKDRGHLVAIGLDSKLAVSSVTPVDFSPGFMALDCHASFPYLFELDGAIHMIPETHQRGSIDLFVSERWPDRWRLVRRLLFGLDAADSMVIHHQGLWYLVTSVQRNLPNRHLEIYITDDVMSGTFVAHPVNRQGLYGHLRHGTGRNAGFLGQLADGSLARLMQLSENHYGEGLSPMRITRLTPDSFAEEPLDGINLFPGMGPGFASHHASRHAGIVVYDVRDRAA